MALLIESTVRARAIKGTPLNESATTILGSRMKKQASEPKHDIFLSHAYEDRQLILGVALTIEDLGYSVYLDWRDDPQLDRKNITSKTTETLRERMKGSKCLFYSVTQHATDSKWMPWELGFMDGRNSRSAIIPIAGSFTTSYSGTEYLGIYPYVSDDNGATSLWFHKAPKIYVSLDGWLQGKEPTQHE